MGLSKQFFFLYEPFKVPMLHMLLGKIIYLFLYECLLKVKNYSSNNLVCWDAEPICLFLRFPAFVSNLEKSFVNTSEFSSSLPLGVCPLYSHCLPLHLLL